MRRFIAFAAVLLFAQSSQAVTLYTKLQDFGPGIVGVHTIGIYIQCDPNSTADDFGFSGAQFDVIAQDTNSNFTGTTSTIGSQVGVLGYSKINPSSGALGQTGGFEFVGKEAWNTTDFDFTGALKLYLTGAQYFADESGQTFKSYDAVVFVPEPSSVVLAMLGGVGLAAIARRRARKAVVDLHRWASV